MGKQDDSTIIARKTLLDSAYNSLLMMQQWGNMHSYHNVLEYEYKARAIIEVLEVADCGSVGGYDRMNALQNEGSSNRLYRRFMAVARKHGDTYERIPFFLD